jgi:cytochrome b561
MGDFSTRQSSSEGDASTRSIVRDSALGAGLFAFAILWVYGSENVSFALRWIGPVTAAHFLTGFLIARWRALLLPIAIVIASIPVPTAAGADSTAFAEVLLYELLVGVPVVAAGIGSGRMNRGAPFFKNRDPWA